MIVAAEKRLRNALGTFIWGVDDDTLEGAVGGLLATRGLTVATTESCTGGLLGSMLTDVPGSSAYYKGGLVAYSNEAKVALGVDAQLIQRHGAVSHEAAKAMAKAGRSYFTADIGVATTGAAGPDGLESRPPGLAFIGISDGLGDESAEVRYPAARQEAKRRVAVHALFILRQRLLSH